LTKYAQGALEIAGKEVLLPEEWPDIEIKASFDDADNATISTEKITLVNNAAQAAIKHIEDGNTGKGVGIFEGLPAVLRIFNDTDSFDAINGYLDLTKDYRQTAGIKAECRLVDPSQMLSFQERADGISYGFLFDQGLITASDFTPVKYVVEKPVNPLELLMIGITTYLMIKELAEAVRDTADAVSNVAAHFAGGVSGSLASILYAIAIALLNAAYAVLLVIAIIALVTQLVQLLFSPVRTHKTTSLRKLLEVGFLHMGHEFSSDIPELDTYFYLPSKPTEEESVQTGIPNTSDFGYTVGELKLLCERLFLAKTRIIDDVVHLRPENDPFWVKTSNYVLPDVIDVEEITRYNTDELKANILLAFETDTSDEWTIENFTGANFEVITTPKTITNDKFVLIKNLDETRFNLALGNRKDELTDIEEALELLASAADKIINLFGGNFSLAGAIQGRKGMLKQWNNIHNLAKLIVIENSRLPKNHRDQLSARHLWEEYHNYKSFVENDFEKQRKIYTDVGIGFGLEDFLTLIDNNYFTTADGRTGKITKFTWNVSKDSAKADFWIENKYTENLQQTLIEA